MPSYRDIYTIIVDARLPEVVPEGEEALQIVTDTLAEQTGDTPEELRDLARAVLADVLALRDRASATGLTSDERQTADMFAKIYLSDQGVPPTPGQLADFMLEVLAESREEDLADERYTTEIQSIAAKLRGQSH